MADPLKIVIEDDVETVHVDPVTGTVEELQDDGGVLVAFERDVARAANDLPGAAVRCSRR
jgi:hypothetical protein